MKFCFSFLFIFLFFSSPVFSEKLISNYIVKAKGITIGSLSWSIEINQNDYKTSIKLKSQGILSGLYKFDGEYKSVGSLLNKQFIP